MKRIQKRNGDIVAFDIKKIEVAINKAANAVSFKDFNGGKQLSEKVESILDETFTNTIPTVEDIQDVVETVLMEENFHKIAKAYILYRKKRTDIRENLNNLLIDGKSLIENYINLKNWRVNENANMGFSLQGLNNHIVETVTKKYWLDEVYDKEIRDAHINGDLHIHDLGLLAPYCCGWDLEAILSEGFRGVMGKVESKPPKHFQSFLGQIVNFLYTLQGEAAGAQAISSLDTYAAPFIYYDKLNYNEVKKIIKSFVFNLNIPTRVGFQTPFTNITLDITPHKLLKNAPVHIDNEYLDKNYGDFQKEMDMFNTAFCEVMMEGDGAGRNFSFPIPTINITDDFPWESPVVKQIMKMTGKYGTPYFANFINSDLLPEDIRSMCCRLRLDNKILRKRGGGLFGANPLTGSINVVTLNMSRIGYLSKDNMDFKKRVEKLCEIAKKTCEIKRTVLENYMEIGLYPYSAFYLKNVKNTTGKYFKNHFSTIGVNGMNEACINFMEKDITSYAGKNFAIEILEYINVPLMAPKSTCGGSLTSMIALLISAFRGVKRISNVRSSSSITSGSSFERGFAILLRAERRAGKTGICQIRTELRSPVQFCTVRRMSGIRSFRIVFHSRFKARFYGVFILSGNILPLLILLCGVQIQKGKQKICLSDQYKCRDICGCRDNSLLLCE